MHIPLEHEEPLGQPTLKQTPDSQVVKLELVNVVSFATQTAQIPEVWVFGAKSLQTSVELHSVPRGQRVAVPVGHAAQVRVPLSQIGCVSGHNQVAKDGSQTLKLSPRSPSPPNSS